MEQIINKVTQSGLITIDLEEFYDETPKVELDIKDQLYMGLMLKEKEFREYVKTNDWNVYSGKYVAIICSTDAIVPTWAYMLIASKLSGIAKGFVFGNTDMLEYTLYKDRIDSMNFTEYANQRVVVKGCGKHPVPVSAYVYLTGILSPVVKSIMYGEPCSTVPVFKKP